MAINNIDAALFGQRRSEVTGFANVAGDDQMRPNM